MSLVRLLLYSNEIEITGFAVTTSTWQKDKVRPDIALSVISAYGQVRGNLLQHANGWPSAEQLAARVSSGVQGYGLAALDQAPLSPGAAALIASARTNDQRPLWVALWGGANTLAQALAHARTTLPSHELDQLIARLRVYSISDQDDAGPWIRREFPGLSYIVSPSSQDGGDYARATWTGISGDQFYRNGTGANFNTVSNKWLDENIRHKGPLGAHYPHYMFIMEGDTPSFLGLIPNGLNQQEQPDWGGWGGRYILRQPAGETRQIWTQGGDSFMRTTSADTVDGQTSDQATIWRWREAFQHDFAARMDWTVLPYARANHPPKVIINGIGENEPIHIQTHTGKPLSLDASASSDPDHQLLDLQWFAYPEAGFSGATPSAKVQIARPSHPRPTIIVTARCAAAWLPLLPCPKTNSVHLILAVSDRGKPRLTRYRRIILEISDE